MTQCPSKVERKDHHQDNRSARKNCHSNPRGPARQSRAAYASEAESRNCFYRHKLWMSLGLYSMCVKTHLKATQERKLNRLLGRQLRPNLATHSFSVSLCRWIFAATDATSRDPRHCGPASWRLVLGDVEVLDATFDEVDDALADVGDAVGDPLEVVGNPGEVGGALDGAAVADHDLQ